MSDCLQRNELPDVLQDAAQRKPRQSPRTAQSGTRDASRGRFPTAHNHPNNYLAEASAMRGEGPTSPLGGRNRRGAGTPARNRNARGTRALHLHMHLKKRLLAQHLELLVLAAAVSHLERRVSPQSPARALLRKHKISQNNYLAEAPAMRHQQRGDTRPLKPRAAIPTSLPFFDIAGTELAAPVRNAADQGFSRIVRRPNKMVNFPSITVLNQQANDKIGDLNLEKPVIAQTVGPRRSTHAITSSELHFIPKL